MRSPHSYSAFSTFLKCPPAYHLCYVQGDEGTTPPALKGGSDNHEAIARYGAHCYQHKRASDLEAGRKIALGYPEPSRSVIEQFIENWRWEWGATIVEGVAPVEQEFRALLPDGRTEFSGHLDLLQCYEGAGDVEAEPFGMDDSGTGDGNLWRITDFKTGLYGEFTEEQPPKQLEWYAWLVQQCKPGARSFEVNLHALRTGRSVSWRLGGDLAYIGNELQAIADRIAREEQWEACPGEHCISCLHVHACPLKGSRTIEALTQGTPAEKLQAYLWHKAQYKALDGLLKAHVKETGEFIEGGGVCYGEQWPEDSVKVTNFPKLVALALEANEVLTTPRSKLPGVARLLKPQKDVAALLLASPEYHERAEQVLQTTKPKRPRIGIIGNGSDDDNGGEE